MKWQQALKDYQSYLRIERGLSENSISNYGLDIKKLITWLDDSKIHTTAITIKARSNTRIYLQHRKRCKSKISKQNYLWA